MAYDGKNRRIIDNGTSINPKPEILKPSDKFSAMFSKRTVDLKSKSIDTYIGVGPKISKYMPQTNIKTNVDGKEVSINEEMVSILNKAGVYDLDKNTPLTHTAMNGFTYKYQQQKGQRSSTAETMAEAWSNIKTLQNNKTGNLFVFDLETFGGKTKDLRWFPQGITEFAMQTHDFATGKTTATNILMTNDEVISGLDKFLTEYQNLMSKMSIDQIKQNHEDVYVTAMRMSLYDSTRGAKFELVDNVWQATQLVDSENALPGNIDVVKRGVEQFRKMNKTLHENETYIDPETGLSYDNAALIKATSRMTNAMANNTGVVGGHNILHFDRPVLDKEIRNIYNKQMAIINDPDSKEEDMEQALKAIEYMNEAFGDNIGFNFKKGKVLDTYPVVSLAANESGFAMPNLQLGTLAEKYYPEEAAEGIAHLGIHDTKVNLDMILNPSKELDNESLIAHLIENDVHKLNKDNPAIELNNKQLFKATGNIQSSSFSGRSYINYRSYNNGDTYTNGGFVIHNDKIEHTKYPGNTGFNKNGFYTLAGQGTININDLGEDVAKQLRSAYPELNTDTLYHVAFNSHTKTVNSNPHTVHLFASTQEELEAMISSNLAHVANITDNGYDLIERNKDLVTNMTYDMKSKKIISSNVADPTETILNALEFSEKQTINDSANRAIFNHEKSLKRINGLITFDEEARKKGFAEGLDKMKTDGVSLSTILKKGDGAVDVSGHDGALKQVRYFSPEKTEELRNIYKQHLGYEDKETGKYEIDFRTLTNTSSAYEVVESKKDYYKNLIKATQEHFGPNINYDDYNANYFFKELDKKASVEVMKDMGLDDEETIIRAVKGTTDSATHEYSYYKNRYDFTVGKGFVKVGEKAQQIERTFGLTSNPDVITYDLSTINPNSNFINKVYKLRMGDKDNSSLTKKEIADYKQQAMYEFIMDQYNNNEHDPIFKNKKLTEYVEKLSTDALLDRAPEDFDANVVATLIGEAVKEAKEKDITAGLTRNLVGDSNILTVKPNTANFFNSTKYEDIVNLGKEIKDLHTYTGQNRKGVVNELMQVFGIDDWTFNEGLKQLDETDAKTAKLIKKVTHAQLESQLDDMVKTMDKHDIAFHVDKLNKQMFVEKNGLVQELTGMPHLDMDEDGKITLVSGNNKLAVGLRLKVHDTKDGNRTYVSTNLDGDFGRKDFFYNMFEDRYYSNNGQIQLSDMNRYIKYHNKETSEYTKYSGMKTDLFTVNNRVNISGAHELYYDMVRKNGPLSNLLENVDPNNKELIQQLRQYQKRLTTDSKLDSNGMPPDIFMLAANDDLALALATLDINDPYYKDFMELSKYMGASLKETAYVKGELQIGDRVVGNITNLFDNPSRPPMTGAGNIKYLKTNDINNLKDLNVLPGSIMENKKTLKGLYREREGIMMTSDFRGRQAYLTGPKIMEMMEEKRAEIIKSKPKINNRTIQDMTDEYLNEVYDHLKETLSSSTYEQSRFGDARVLNNILNMPVDVQYLSVNKDVIGAMDRRTDQNKIQRLIDVAGTIDVNEKGEYVYKRRAGTVVKRGETVAEYTGYGGIKQAFGSKHDKGILHFSISTNNQELTDSQISKIINEYGNQFDGLKTQEEKFSTLYEILEAKGLKATFKIENANQASLFKIQDAGVEKGMTYAPNVQLGRLNKKVKSYFTALQNEDPDNKMVSAFLNGMIPHERAIKALHEDIAAKKGITVEELVNQVSKSSFKSMNELLDLVKDERESLSVLAFGEHGVFNGFMSVANDNIIGHDNVGLDVFGNFSEAIRKYSEISGKSFSEAVLEIGTAMQQNDELNFIRQTMHDASGKITKDKGRAFKIDDVGTFILEDLGSEKMFIDKTKLVNNFKYINDLIVELDANAPEEMKLVHKNVYTRGDDGKISEEPIEEIIGNFIIRERDGKKVIEGSTSYANHSIIADSETVSRASQEYIEAKRVLNKYKEIDPDKLTKEDKEKIKMLREVIDSQKDHTKFVTADDQMISRLKNERFSNELAEDLKYSLELKNGKEEYFTKEKAEYLSKESGGNLKFNSETGEFTISDKIKGTSPYDAFVDKIMSQQYYNDIYGDELTAEMLKDEKYAHLKGIYDDVIGGGKTDKLGVQNAQNIYDLQGMSKAANFNRNAFDKDEMQNLIDNYDFKLMNIRDYTPTEGAAGNGPIESIRDKRIMLDLGEQFSDNQRYVAIPAGGQQLGNMEALTEMQGMIKQIKTHSNNIERLEIGSINNIDPEAYRELPEEIRKNLLKDSQISPELKNKYEKELNAMQDVRDKIAELSDKYVRKDSAYTDSSKVVIMEASERAKIMSVTNTSILDEDLKEMGITNVSVDKNSATFMKKAKIINKDGTEQSLYDLSKKGIHYDFERVGIDHFINEGLLDASGEATSETLKKFGMNSTEELINHLETYGNVDMTMRFPLIAKNSMYGTRVFLDREFDGKNIKSVSSYSMLKYIGDSDGDSESGFQATYDGVNFALYEHQRKQAIAEIKSSNKTLSDEEFQKAVKEQVVSKGKVSSEAYDAFYDLSFGMDYTAVVENPQWANKVKVGMLEDGVKNVKAGSIENMGSIIKDAESETFKNYRYESMHLHPSQEIVSANMNEVRGAVTKALDINKDLFEGETLDIATKISSGTLHMNEVKGTEKYKVLDIAMKALESDDKFAASNEFMQMQQALIDRVGIQHAFEEEGSKSAKAAIGTINNLLSSLKTVGTEAFNNPESNLYDVNKGKLLNEASYKMEQQVISFKKVAAEIGDSRVVELENIMAEAKRGNAGKTEKKQFTEWLGTYLSKGDTETIWNEMRPSVRANLEKEGGYLSNFIIGERNLGNSNLSEEEMIIKAKNAYIADEYINAVNALANDPKWGSDIIDVAGAGKKTSSDNTISRKKHSSSSEFMNSKLNDTIKERPNIPNPKLDFVTKDQLKNESSTLDLDFSEYIDEFSNNHKQLDLKPSINSDVLTKAPALTLGTGIGIAALGVAAGLMVAGYAGGGHQRPTKPQDDSQPVEVTPMLDDNAGDNGMRQQGYVINIKADTNKGARHLKKTLKDIAKVSSNNGNVSINMNYKTTSGGGYSNNDIENIINNFI